MIRSVLSAVALYLVSATITYGQNWTVGQPVSMHLSDLQLSSDNCWNQGQQNDDVIYFPQSMVTGVQHAYIINTAMPPNTVGFGSPGNIVNGGDTVYITAPSQQFQIYFTGGSGGTMDLSVYAIGTPQLPGEAHPCQFSGLWLQNFLICNTGYNNNISTGCTTQTTTAIQDQSGNAPMVNLPNPQNGFQLQVLNAHSDADLQLFDLLGNQVASANSSQLADGIGLSHLVQGIYFYTLRYQGEEYSAKFALTK